MERPKKLSGEQKEYIEYLEGKIADFSVISTKRNSYFALKKTVDGLNSLMFNGIELPVLDEEGIPTGKLKKYDLLAPESLSSKDDKIFDRIFKFMEKQDSFISTMDKLSENISPEELEDAYGSEYEEVQDMINNG